MGTLYRVASPLARTIMGQGLVLFQVGSAEQPAALPASLLEATTALRQAGSGGVAFKLARIRLGALKIDLKHYTQIDVGVVKDWPLTGLDLNKADVYGPPSGGLVLSEQSQVDKIVALLKGTEDVMFAANSVVYRQGSSYFWVAFVVMVP